MNKIILKAVQSAYKNAKSWNWETNVLLKKLREYHITISVANFLSQEINHNDDFNIFIEYPTRKFENYLFEGERYGYGNVFEPYPREISIEISRSGFLDIVLMRKTNDIYGLLSEYIIEIKGIIPYNKILNQETTHQFIVLRKDFIRNFEFLCARDIHQYHSQNLISCFQAFIIESSYNTDRTIDIINNDESADLWIINEIDKITETFNKWIPEKFKETYSIQVSYEKIEFVPISRTPIREMQENPDPTGPADMDIHSVMEATGIALACCVELKRERYNVNN